ncbi:MAG: hypothetical protein QOG97_2488, partial [Acidimicrobiaceae bacterium]|nr:hypothetical protein [Acidimicrobiaceae bacterium]
MTAPATATLDEPVAVAELAVTAAGRAAPEARHAGGDQRRAERDPRPACCDPQGRQPGHRPKSSRTATGAVRLYDGVDVMVALRRNGGGLCRVVMPGSSSPLPSARRRVVLRRVGGVGCRIVGGCAARVAVGGYARLSISCWTGERSSAKCATPGCGQQLAPWWAAGDWPEGARSGAHTSSYPGADQTSPARSAVTALPSEHARYALPPAL